MRKQVTFYFRVPWPVEWLVHTVLFLCLFIGIAVEDGSYFIVFLIGYGVYNVLLRACCMKSEITVLSDAGLSIRSVSSNDEDSARKILSRLETSFYESSIPVCPSWLIHLGLSRVDRELRLDSLVVTDLADDQSIGPASAIWPELLSWSYSIDGRTVQIPDEIKPRTRAEARELIRRLGIPIKEETSC